MPDADGPAPGSHGGPPASVALVVNPSAAKGGALTVLPRVTGRLRDAGHAVEVLLSRSPAEAGELVTAAAASGADVLAVLGGDGMAHLGLNAVARRAADDPTTAPALGLVPAGTGNDLARGLGLALDDLDAAVGAVVAGRTRPVDLLRVADRWVGTVVATGFDALVNARANRMAWPRGSARYLLAVLAEVRTFRPLRYSLVVDGAERELDAMFVSVGNTTSFGGGLKICPRADPYDGELDVTIIHPVSRAGLLRLLPQMKSGRFAADPCVEQLRARSVHVAHGAGTAYGDGEELGPTPVAVELVPAAIRVCLP
ncbi:diacylglycerol/lipid kinase family protein [Microlunatus flavus]|uniref:Diacylglycerol kinase (ATP) n=1 Tax=Microlunatus flavus TaxID=1036181 RepID=A0A1H9MS85_9ACTN|nr:YegS/Rv2252/BmrU family lipid kinase [Microlunatus flavus]SER26542.1 diacylglycerol kinase (ATP) [Microlunatus flavus]